MADESSVSTAFLDGSRRTLTEGLHKIEHCVEQLSEEQIWWRPRPEMNSIANLMLHLSGNLGQWIVSGVGGEPDIRNRPKEFADRSARPKAELLRILRSVLSDCDAAIARSAGRLTASRRIQGHDETTLSAILHAVTHFRGHVQEIIHMTRVQLGDRYRFDFVPKGVEQEAAAGPGI